MRRGFAISLLILLGCPYWGTHAILLHRKHEIKEAVKHHLQAGVTDSELVQLSFPRNGGTPGLRWHHSREFEYLGEMYDVVRSEERADSVSYWCIHDRAETLVNRQLECLVAQASGSDPLQQSSLGAFFQFLKSLFFDPPTEAVACPAMEAEPPAYCAGILASFLTAPPVPPPKV